MFDANEFLRLRSAGLGYKTIAERLGMNYNTLRGRVSKQSLTMRGKRQPEHTMPAFSFTPDVPSFEELMEVAKVNRDLLDRILPSITSETITLKTDRPVAIIYTSCAHLGGRYTFYEEFQRVYEETLGIDNLYWVSLGDDVEGFLPGFPDGSAVVNQALVNPEAQRLILAHVLDGLATKGKLLCGCASQHGGDWVRKRVGEDPIAAMYRSRGVPFFNGKAIVKLQVGSEEYVMALAHEFRGSSAWNPNHATRKAGLLEFPNADVVVMGDKHTSAVQKVTKNPTEFDAGLRNTTEQWLLQVGTMKTGNDPYSIRGWSRGQMGWPIMLFHPHRHEIVYAPNLEVAQILLREWN